MSNSLEIQFRSWRSGDHRAPHKPLLVALALARLAEGQRWISWTQVEEELSMLLSTFCHDPSPKPNYPFIRLQTDGIWELRKAEGLVYTSSGDASLKSLKALNPEGGLSDAFIAACEENAGPNWALLRIREILDSEFPPSLHDEILAALNVDDSFSSVLITRKSRSPEFRQQVLDIYNGQCAICGFSGRLKGKLVGVEAAHIKWFAFGGPDEIRNGLALCSLHHKLFDLGAIGLSDELRILISPRFSGEKTRAMVLDFEGKEIFIPRQRSMVTEPEAAFVRWQRSQVYQDWVG